MFALVTLSGVLIVQNSAFLLFAWMLRDYSLTIASQVQSVTGLHLAKEFFDINISNALASLVVMVWNYNGYRLFVFNDKAEASKELKDEETITLPA
jgi:putative flippase GtrA